LQIRDKYIIYLININTFKKAIKGGYQLVNKRLVVKEFMEV